MEKIKRVWSLAGGQKREDKKESRVAARAIRPKPLFCLQLLIYSKNPKSQHFFSKMQKAVQLAGNELFKKWRKILLMTQDTVATLLKTSRVTVGNWERGNTELRLNSEQRQTIIRCGGNIAYLDGVGDITASGVSLDDMISHIHAKIRENQAA